jgi:glutaredoxin
MEARDRGDGGAVTPPRSPAALRPSRRSLWGLVVLIVLVMGAQQAWQEHKAGQVGNRVAAAAEPGDIRMLSSTTCAICVVARRWMEQHGVAYEECFIETDPGCRAEFDARMAVGTPVIVVRDQPQLGFSPERLLGAVER